MRYSIEPKDRIYVKGYGFMSFAKDIGNKYRQKSFDTARESTTEAIETASKMGVQKIAEATGDLIGSKIADQITSISKKSVKELPNNDDEDTEITTHQKDTYHQKKDSKLFMN